MARLGSSPAEVGAGWADLLRLLPGYDPFRAPGQSWFDPEPAANAIAFVEECLVHVEGDMTGKPFLLEPWQKSVVANLFGWRMLDEMGREVRRYREVLLYVPRKNGKTPLAAAIALLVFFCDRESGQQDYLAAADREQAALLFRHCKGMVEREPQLKNRCRIYGGNAAAGQSRSLHRESDGSFLRVIAADAAGQHGGNSHLVIVDELHTQPNRDLVDVLTTSTASANRKQPLVMHLTTADFDRPSICNEKHRYACQVRDGVIDDPRFLPIVYEAGKDDDWTSEKVWEKANPNLGVSVSREYLRTECEKAKNTPAYEHTYRRLHLNQQTQAAAAAIRMDRWAECGKIPLERDDLVGRNCFGGLDLASTTDIAAFLALFPIPAEKAYACLAKFWAPRDNARERQKRDRVPYLMWAEQGWLTLTDGDVIDYDVIRRDINEFAAHHNLLKLAADRWNATQILGQLQGDGIEVVGFGQGFQSMTAPTKDLIAIVSGIRLAHGGNPVLTWMAGNLTVEQNAAGDLKPSKKRSPEKIDGMVSLIMSIGLAILPEATAGSVYEERGVLWV